jgi:hypothetical protein
VQYNRCDDVDVYVSVILHKCAYALLVNLYKCNCKGERRKTIEMLFCLFDYIGGLGLTFSRLGWTWDPMIHTRRTGFILRAQAFGGF